jgi:hypothetical protein
VAIPLKPQSDTFKSREFTLQETLNGYFNYTNNTKNNSKTENEVLYEENITIE